MPSRCTHGAQYHGLDSEGRGDKANEESPLCVARSDFRRGCSNAGTRREVQVDCGQQRKKSASKGPGGFLFFLSTTKTIFFFALSFSYE